MTGRSAFTGKSVHGVACAGGCGRTVECSPTGFSDPRKIVVACVLSMGDVRNTSASSQVPHRTPSDEGLACPPVVFGEIQHLHTIPRRGCKLHCSRSRSAGFVHRPTHDRDLHVRSKRTSQPPSELRSRYWPYEFSPSVPCKIGLDHDRGLIGNELPPSATFHQFANGRQGIISIGPANQHTTLIRKLLGLHSKGLRSHGLFNDGPRSW